MFYVSESSSSNVVQSQTSQVSSICTLTNCFVVYRMRGVVSAAMVMCASSGDKTEIIDPPAGAVPGERVVFEGYTGLRHTYIHTNVIHFLGYRYT